MEFNLSLVVTYQFNDCQNDAIVFEGEFYDLRSCLEQLAKIAHGFTFDDGCNGVDEFDTDNLEDPNNFIQLCSYPFEGLDAYFLAQIRPTAA